MSFLPPHCMMCDHLSPPSLLALPSPPLPLGAANASALSLASRTARLSLELSPKLNHPPYIGRLPP